MKKFYRTVFLITAAIILFTACSITGGDNSALNGGVFAANGSGVTITKKSSSSDTSIAFVKTEGEGEPSATAQFGNKISDHNYFVIELKATDYITVLVEAVMSSLSDPSKTLTLTGEAQLTLAREKYCIILSYALQDGFDVFRSVTVYPAYSVKSGKGEVLVRGCYLSKNYEQSTIITVSEETSSDSLGGDTGSSGSFDSGSQSQSGSQSNSGSQTSSSQTNSSKTSSSSQSGEGGQSVQVDYLYQKYADYFPIGYAIGADHINQYKGGLDKHYNSFTCENEMKMYSIAPNYLEQDNFGAADSMISYVRSQGKVVRGHALVWHNGAPGWLTNVRDKSQMLSLIEQYVTRVVNHFGNNVYCWDVVNEAIDDDYNYPNYRSTFYDVCGIDYIKTAFRAARAANPSLKLFYNDYNMDQPKKRAKVIEMIKELQRDGVPIDGVGMQGHYNLKDTSINSVENAIREFAALGLEVQITELDIKNYGNQNPDGQARLYGELFSLFRRYSNVITGVTFWNVADDYSWLDGDQFSYYGTGKAYPTIFDTNHNKKTAFYNIFNF